MKNADVVLLTIVSIILMLFFLVLAGGCSLFQMSGADKLASLPETPKQQLFQTIAKTNWLFTLSVVGVGAGFFAFLNGSSKGLQFMAACFVVISLIIGLTRYSAWIAAIAMIGTVCLMVYSVLVKNKAIREVVAGVQAQRDDLGAMTGRIDSFLAKKQSKTTKDIVRAVKDKL